MLSTADIKRIVRDGEAGTYPDNGNGLYLRVHKTKAGKATYRWVQSLKIDSKWTWVGLGPLSSMGVRQARQKASENVGLVAFGIDPRTKIKAKAVEQFTGRPADTIRSVAESIDVSTDQMERHCPSLIERPLASVTVDAVVNALDGVPPSVAKRIRQSIARVYAYAIDAQLVSHNPAKAALERLPSHTGGNHRAVAHSELGAVLSALEGSYADMVRLVALTATRVSEVTGMRWEEIDLEARVWTIPPERTKTNITHRIPLSVQAMQILGRASKSDGLVFPSGKGVEIQRARLTETLRGTGTTTHGMRSAFSSWCADSEVDREVREKALGHRERNAVVESYMRSDLLERRVPVMQAWADYLTQ